MKLTTLSTLGILATALAALAAPAMANELDHAAGSAPQALIVREDASGNREVFKANPQGQVTDAAAAEKVATQFATEANRIAQVMPSSELDRSASSEAWYSWYSPYYSGSYYYSYQSYNYSWNYYPCYSWNWSSYRYYYYSWY